MQYIRVRNRIINLAAISYVRFAEDHDRVEIRLLGPSKDVSLTLELDGEEAIPVREFFLKSGIVRDLRPHAAGGEALTMSGDQGGIAQGYA